MTVTLSEIAQVAGVSVSTVSRALNRTSHSVGEATRDRILQIADELSYKPNLNARGLRRNRSYAVGIIADDIADLTLHSVDGFIFAHARFKSSLQKSRQTDKPYVFVNRGFTPATITVGADNYYDAQVMIGHLLRPGIAPARTAGVLCRER